MNFEKSRASNYSSKGIVIFDLDGTLADNTHRQHVLLTRTSLVDPKTANWKAFYKACPNDKPIEEAIEICNVLYSRGYKVVIITGRGEVAFKETIDWLKKYDVNYHELHMRGKLDYRTSDEYKESVLEKFPIDYIKMVFDDSEKDIEMYKEHGIKTFLVDAK